MFFNSKILGLGDGSVGGPELGSPHHVKARHGSLPVLGAKDR